MMSLGQDCNIFYLLSDEDNAVMVGWAHSFWTSCVVSMMLVGALGGNDTIPTAATLSHPERMLARFLPGHHHVQSRIQRQGPVFIQSGVRDATVPVVVLHGDVQQTIHALGLEESFAYIEPDYIVQSLSMRLTTPQVDDPYFQESWHMQAVEAIQSWNIIRGDSDTKICIIDSGVDLHHEDLVDNVKMSGYDAIQRQHTWWDVHGHGTMCAGIVAATPDNGKGVSGLMWNANILSCRFLGNDGHGYLSDAIQCMQWCVDHDARILSNSWGTYSTSRALEDSMDYFAKEFGVIYVTAAGNEGINNDGQTPMYPASYNLTSIISVAATDRSGQLAPFSNYGAHSVDIAAPGVDIISTWINDTYKSMSGTSFATPLVAATLGLMASVRPDIQSMDTLKSILLDSARRTPLLSDAVVESRFLSVYDAVKAAYLYKDINVGANDTFTRDPLYDHVRVLDASSLPLSSAILTMPDDRVADVLVIPDSMKSRCPTSRYSRYNIRSYMNDTLIPKHLFVIEHAHEGYSRLTVDTCIQPGGPWDSILVVLDCSMDLQECNCSANNDGCGSKRQGSKIRFRIGQGRRYLAVVLSSDPLETGSYRLRINGTSKT